MRFSIRFIPIMLLIVMLFGSLHSTKQTVATPELTPTRATFDHPYYIPLVMKDVADIVATPTATATATVIDTPTNTATATVTATPTSTATATETPKIVNLHFTEQQEWNTIITSNESYDIVIVQDFSESMRYCWDSNVMCSSGQRRIDAIIPALNNFLHERLVVQKNQGFDHRVGLVTFGPLSNRVSTAKIVVQLTNNTLAFSDVLGTGVSGYTVPDNQLEGGSAWAQALHQASVLLQDTSYDMSGHPRRKAVLFITDGPAFVLYDQPYFGVYNGHYPFNCGPDVPDTYDNPVIQYYCPDGQLFRSPIKAAIDIAHTMTMSHNIEINSLAVTTQFISDELRLNNFSERSLYVSPNDTAGLNDFLNHTANGISERTCLEHKSPILPATYATVQLIDPQTQSVIQTIITNQQGQITTMLGLNPVIVEAYHYGVVSPNDPNREAKNYILAPTLVDTINPPAAMQLMRSPSTPLCP